MLRQVKLSNFKCFENLELNCAPLTLLCGLNGMGKSTVIQALLVLRQSIETIMYPVPHELILQGDRTDLGTGADVLFEGAKTNNISIELHDEEIPEPYSLQFEYSWRADRLLMLEESRTSRGKIAIGWNRAPPIGGDLFYVSAERVGPRKFYPLLETAGRRGNIGVRSEMALAHWHTKRGLVLHEDDPRCVGQSTKTMSAVLESWLDAVSPGVHLQLEAIQDADALLARFSFDRPGDVNTRPYRATNVGFGLSYTLPVLIALLSSRGTMCLIENPEAHLHPRGQTKLAELAVAASIAGVQVFIETHSDHFIDGVRISVRNGLIPPEKVAIHYFEREGDKSVISSPVLDRDGRLSSWPTGFFDQHEKNLAKLLQPRI
ncbi:MAG: DUF3696 domain-containing protein [Rhodobacteraceae bacterium]|nr:DUF3696 domain-containing protein [Paracoccaceae bacterium]